MLDFEAIAPWNIFPIYVGQLSLWGDRPPRHTGPWRQYMVLTARPSCILFTNFMFIFLQLMFLFHLFVLFHANLMLIFYRFGVYSSPFWWPLRLNRYTKIPWPLHWRMNGKEETSCCVCVPNGGYSGWSTLKTSSLLSWKFLLLFAKVFGDKKWNAS